MNQFLPHDVKLAERHLNCYEECKELVDVHIKHGNYDMAMHRLADATKSVHELSVLANKKKIVDRHNDMVERLEREGIQVQVVRGIFHERKID